MKGFTNNFVFYHLKYWKHSFRKDVYKIRFMTRLQLVGGTQQIYSRASNLMLNQCQDAQPDMIRTSAIGSGHQLIGRRWLSDAQLKWNWHQPNSRKWADTQQGICRGMAVINQSAPRPYCGWDIGLEYIAVTCQCIFWPVTAMATKLGLRLRFCEQFQG